MIEAARVEQTLTEAQEWLEARLEDGAVCPCCGQYARIYKRKLNAGMAKSLVWLVNVWLERGDGEWIDVPATAPRFVLQSREFGKLAHWGLLECAPNVSDPTKKHSGLWRPTLKGVEFVQGQTRLPAQVFLFDNAVTGWSVETTGIDEALGDGFDYEELMAS